MNGKKKIISCVIASVAVIAIAGIIIFLNAPVHCLRVQLEGIPVDVSFYSEESALDSFFSPAVMGRTYDYRIVVRENGLFGSTLLKSNFTFRNDGAPIHDYNVLTESENNIVKIKICGDEMSDKLFEVQLD